MIRNYTPSHVEEITLKAIQLIDSSGYGFSFNMDDNLQPVLISEAARQKYEYALAHPEDFDYKFNEAVVERWRYTVPASEDCICGEHIELIDQYIGACQCPRCGRWYNLFGQSLLPPSYWSRDDYEY